MFDLKGGTSLMWNTGAYCRLSRDDGDRVESDSIQNQKQLLERHIDQHADLALVDFYCDDGYTGTNFNRPDFQRLMEDVGDKRVNCIIVKDLSRFGRDYIDVGRYLERVFPDLGVRFVAVGDNVDSQMGRYDMMLPLKNVFNEQYARDISQKVKASLKTKQRSGQFIGAFASYGYLKDPRNKNKLVIDPVAAVTVRRIFDLYESGVGKIAIAKELNQEKIPCPSIYKEQMGQRYHNGQRLGETSYWTYATIHRMLGNQIYAGHMVQGKNQRLAMHGKTKQLGSDQWVVVPNTHEAMIAPAQWDRVQILLKRDTRTCNFEENVSTFAGFLRCGDCGRAMSKTTRSGGVSYSCGSYKRYGAGVCTAHYIRHDELERLMLEDINSLLVTVENLPLIVQQAATETQPKRTIAGQEQRIQLGLERVYKLKKRCYEDYADGLLNREDYMRLKEDYDLQEKQMEAQRRQAERAQEKPSLLEQPWIKGLLEHRRIKSMDRLTLAELVKNIEIYENGRVNITYQFELPEGG